MTPVQQVALRFRGGYGLANLEGLLRLIRPLVERDRGAVRVAADFRELTWFEPAAMTLVVATLMDVARRGEMATGSSYRRPEKRPVADYLDRMRVFDIISEGADAGNAGTDHGRGSRPCNNFRDLAAQVEVSGDLVAAIAEEAGDFPEPDRLALRVCLEELTENVLHHAETPGLGGFAAAQVYRQRSSIQVAIADLGRGIRASLNSSGRFGELADDVSAIDLARSLRVTATPERNGGFGLFVTGRVAETNGGRMVIRSGTGSVILGEGAETTTTRSSLGGTLIVMELRTDQPISLEQAYGSENGDVEGLSDLFGD